MLAQKILALLTVAVAASAVPAPVPQDDQQQACGNGFTAKCCNQVVRQTLNLIPVNVGIQCVDVDGKLRNRLPLWGTR